MAAEVPNGQQALNSIRGVPGLKWGEWRDRTFCSAVTVLVNTIGVDVTYEQVMGLSGACYRICMREDWCPSAALPQTGYDVETPLYRALGFQPYEIDDRRRGAGRSWSASTGASRCCAATSVWRWSTG